MFRLLIVSFFCGLVSELADQTQEFTKEIVEEKEARRENSGLSTDREGHGRGLPPM